MKIISLNNFLTDMDFYIQEAEAGKMFIYPTDTIYGIGWIYTIQNREKIFAIKKRDKKKIFSIIAPNFERIKKQYSQSNIEYMKEYLNTYHGVTYIFDYTQPGVRIIKHPIQQFVEKLNKPFITTSCNIAGEPIVTDITKIPEEIATKVDYIVDGGTGWGKPSVLIDFVQNKVIER